MATKKQSVKQKRKGKKRREEMGATAVPSETASLSLDKLPDHETTRPLRQAQLLQMQQEQGNAQVQRLLQQNKQQVQRYESPEHQDLGDAHLDELHDYLHTDEGQAWASEHGLPAGLSQAIGQDAMRRGQRFLKTASGLHLTDDNHVPLDSEIMLTFGDVIALMGDLYPTWQAIVNAPVEDVRGLLHTMRQERYGYISTDEATQGYETHSGGNYLRLAQQNAAHFAPANRAEWQELHEAAMAKAKEAGNNEQLFAEALFMDAAANHFLTDAFAAGHLLKKPEVEAAIMAHLQANPIQDSDPEMQFYISIVQMSGNLPNLVLKNVHDHLNTSGFEISNEQGMSWRTYGDASLDKEAAAETRQACEHAKALSEIGEKLREGSEGPLGRAMLALCRYQKGEADHRAALEAALQELRDVDAKQRLAFVLTQAAAIESERGDLESAGARAAEAEAIGKVLQQPSESALARAVLLRIARKQGDDAQVRQLTQELRESKGYAKHVGMIVEQELAAASVVGEAGQHGRKEQWPG